MKGTLAEDSEYCQWSQDLDVKLFLLVADKIITHSAKQKLDWKQSLVAAETKESGKAYPLSLACILFGFLSRRN